jgi:tetratricopeptide (TPR) repeat protein
VDGQVGQLAYSAANAVVGAMATDGWKAAQGLFRRWFKSRRRQGLDDVNGLLEDWRRQLVRAQQKPDSAEYWKYYAEIQAALTMRFIAATEDDAAARAELHRLGAEWLALPGVAAQVAGSQAHLARVYGELLEEPETSARVSPALRRSEEASAPSIGNLLPATTTRFTDRDELLDRLCPRIVHPEDRIRVLNLCGEGGVGKTALAAKIAESVASSFHGRLYVDLRGSTGEGAVEPAAALERLLREIEGGDGRILGDERWRLDAYRRLTAGMDLLFLLDDAASFAQVRPLISASPTSLTIVTSRDPMPGLAQEFGATIVRVPRFDDANSLKLLRRVAGLDDLVDPSATPVSAAQLEAVIRQCAGLPLAVCIMAARIAVGDVDLDQYLESAGSTGAPARPDVLAGYRSLPPEAVRLHRLLCYRPWPSITAGPAAAAIGVHAEVAEPLLELLLDVGLLEQAQGSTVEKPRYKVPKLVREEALRMVRTPHDVQGAVAGTRAMVCWYLAFAVFADWEVNGRWRLGPLYEPLEKARDEARRTRFPEPRRYADKVAALAALEGEFGNLEEAVRAAADQRLHGLVSQLCEALWGFFLMRGRAVECVAVHRFGVAAAVASGDLRMQARMRVQLAFGLLWQERFDEAEAEFEHGFAADRAAGHDRGLATALESVGLVWLAREDFARAAELFLEARVFAERVGAPRALALLHYHYGRALSGLGRFDEAESEFGLAMAKFNAEVRPRDAFNEGKVMMGGAQKALRAGHPEQARGLLAEAAQVMADEGAVVTQGQVSVLRAWCAELMGDFVAERAFLVEAQDFYVQTGSSLAPKVRDRIRFLDAAIG